MSDNPESPLDATIAGGENPSSAETAASTTTAAAVATEEREEMDSLLQELAQSAPDSTSTAADAATPAADPPAGPAAAAAEAAVEGHAAADSQDFELPEFSLPADAPVDLRRISLLNDVNLRVRVELGRTRMLVEDVLRLDEGSVVELDKLAGDPVDIYVNDRLLARGEVLVLNDAFCVRISEVLTHDPHRVVP